MSSGIKNQDLSKISLHSMATAHKIEGKLGKFWICRPKLANSRLTGQNSCWIHFFQKISLDFQCIFLKMDVKFAFFDLDYLWFDTKNVQFDEIWGMELQTRVFYSLSGLSTSRSAIKIQFASSATKMDRKYVKQNFF